MTDSLTLIPTIIQDATTKQVLMLGYSNDESLAKTKATGHVWFYSRSKQRLWEKGEASRNYLNMVEIFSDCDNDTLLITVTPEGPTCHTEAVSCFGATPSDVVARLEQTIEQRQQDMPEKSYTAQLLHDGTKAIGNKVTEEAIEVVQAARFEGQQRLAEESADLLYHLLVLLRDQHTSWCSVLDVLHQRHKP